MSLKEKTIKSLFWIYLFKGLWLMINFGRSVVLARLLFPNDFAIIGLATTFIYFIEQLFTFGFSKILIYKQNITQEELDTAFSLNLIQNIVFFTIIYFCAPYVADFYHKPILELVVRILGFEILMQCIGFIPRVILQKEMKFKVTSTIEFVTSCIGTIILLILAFSGWGFWSLVAASVISKFIQAVSFLYFSHLNANLRLHKDVIKEFLKYTTVIYSTAILTYLSSSLDIVIIGKLSGMLVLGYYTVAKQWARYFHNNFFSMITQVLFPGFAKIQHDKQRLKQALMQTLYISFPLFMPVYVGFFMVADRFVVTFLGNKWVPSIIPMKILFIAIIIETLGWISGPISDAMGKFEVKLKQRILIITLFVPLLIGFGRLIGLPGYALSKLIVSTVGFSYYFYVILKKELGISLKELLITLFPALIGCMGMILCILMIEQFSLLANNEYVDIFIIVVTGAISYALILFLFFKDIFDKYLLLAKQYILKGA